MTRLYDLLDWGGGDPVPESPYEWIVSRVCETFSCTPGVAERELDRDPQLVSRVMELRAFAEAKRQVESADEDHPLVKTPMVIEYLKIFSERVRARIAEANNQHG